MMIRWGTFVILCLLTVASMIGGFYQPVLGIFTLVFGLGAVWAFAEARGEL